MTGSGTLGDPYIIADLTDLAAVNDDLTAYYELGTDIDCSATSSWWNGEGWFPIAPELTIIRRYPSADILKVGSWTTYPADGVYWTKVDDLLGAEDDDSSYITAVLANDRILFSVADLASLPDHGFQIGYVNIEVRCRTVATGTSSWKGILKIGGVEYQSTLASNVSSQTYTHSFAQWPLNPATGLAWTWAGLQTIQCIGVICTDATPDLRFTAIRLDVEYESDPFIGHFDGKGHTLSGLVINRLGMVRPLQGVSVVDPWSSYNQALFGYVGGGAYLGNMLLSGFSIEASGGELAALAGTCDVSITSASVEIDSVDVDDCYIYGGKDGDLAALLAYQYSDDPTDLLYVHDCDLTNINIRTVSYVSGMSIGGLLGEVFGIAHVEDCTFDGTLVNEGNGYTGGIVAWFSEGAIRRCDVTGTIWGHLDSGGIAGWLGYDYSLGEAPATCEDCTFDGTMYGGDNACSLGGIAAWAADVTVLNCHTSGKIIGNPYFDSTAGGLIAWCIESSIITEVQNCYSSAEVWGGAAGGCFGALPNRVYISECYATGDVHGANSYAGGFVGYDYCGVSEFYVKNCYARGDVSNVDGAASGGFVGELETIYQKCYSTGKAYTWELVGVEEIAYTGSEWSQPMWPPHGKNAAIMSDGTICCSFCFSDFSTTGMFGARVAFRSPLGVWSTETAFSHPATDHADIYSCSMCVDSVDDLHLVYWLEDSGGNSHGLYHVKRDHTTGLWAAPVLIDAVGESPAIAVDSNDTLWVISPHWITPDWSINLYNRPIATGVWSAGERIDDGGVHAVGYGQWYPSICVDGLDDVHMAWHGWGYQPNVSVYQTLYRRKNADGSWESLINVSNEASTSCDSWETCVIASSVGHVIVLMVQDSNSFIVEKDRTDTEFLPKMPLEHAFNEPNGGFDVNDVPYFTGWQAADEGIIVWRDSVDGVWYEKHPVPDSTIWDGGGTILWATWPEIGGVHTNVSSGWPIIFYGGTEVIPHLPHEYPVVMLELSQVDTPAGGFSGSSVGTPTVVQCYWDTESSLCPLSADAEVGKTTAEMKLWATFVTPVTTVSTFTPSFKCNYYVYETTWDAVHDVLTAEDWYDGVYVGAISHAIDDFGDERSVLTWDTSLLGSDATIISARMLGDVDYNESAVGIIVHLVHSEHSDVATLTDYGALLSSVDSHGSFVFGTGTGAYILPLNALGLADISKIAETRLGLRCSLDINDQAPVAGVDDEYVSMVDNFLEVTWTSPGWSAAVWLVVPACNNGYPCLINTTPSCEVPLSVETDAATSILAHGATLNGDLTNIGGLSMLDVYFEYGLSTGVYTYTTAIQVMTAIGTFHEHITLLQNNTTYYFRAVASDGVTTVYGAEESFVTVTPTSPYKTIVAGVPVQITRLTLKPGWD